MRQIWCIQTQSDTEGPALSGVTVSETKAREMKKELEKKVDRETQVSLYKVNANTLYLNQRTAHFDEAVQHEDTFNPADIQNVWCIKLSNDQIDPFIAGFATSQEIVEDMQERIQEAYGTDMNVSVHMLEADHILYQQPERQSEKEASYNINQIDEKMQRAFQLLAYSEEQYQRCEYYGHTITAKIDTQEHIIKRVEIDGEKVYDAETGSVSIESLAGLATLKMCDLLEAEGRYIPTVYDFEPPEPASDLGDDGRFWEEGVAKDIDWYEDFLLDPHKDMGMEH